MRNILCKAILFLLLFMLGPPAYAQGGNPPAGLEPVIRFDHPTADELTWLANEFEYGTMLGIIEGIDE